MDCVGCDKCRLWGKLQTQALGTALKILFTESKFTGFGSTIEADAKQNFKLSRVEIFALINGFGRLSTSINEIDKFRHAEVNLKRLVIYILISNIMFFLKHNPMHSKTIPAQKNEF